MFFLIKNIVKLILMDLDLERLLKEKGPRLRTSKEFYFEECWNCCSVPLKEFSMSSTAPHFNQKMLLYVPGAFGVKCKGESKHTLL